MAASTQNQALSALLFLYREVLRKDLASAPRIGVRQNSQRAIGQEVSWKRQVQVSSELLGSNPLPL